MASDISVVKKTVWQGGLIILTALIISFMVNHFRPEGLPIIGDWTPEGKIAATSGTGLVIALEEAKKLHVQKKALFLDARPDAWYEMGHIKGAKNLPPSQFDELFAKVLGDTPKNSSIVAYCDGRILRTKPRSGRGLGE